MHASRGGRVAHIPAQHGRLAVVTGANSGIGWHTALELARAGAEVVLAARSEAKGKDAVTRILQELPKAKVRSEMLDLASLRSVREFAARLGSGPKLDLLVNNARAVRTPERRLTEDGFEMQMGTNFMGPFALTGLLLPVLLRSDAPRVTTVSSGAAQMGLKRIRFEDMQWEKDYAPWNAYCQSKLADLMLTVELARRVKATGVRLVSNAAHPGYARTNLPTSGPKKEMSFLERLMTPCMSHDAAAGALPTLRAATSPAAGPGSYFAPRSLFHLKCDPGPVPMPKQALDAVAAKRLWEVAEELTGVGFVGIW